MVRGTLDISWCRGYYCLLRWLTVIAAYVSPSSCKVGHLSALVVLRVVVSSSYEVGHLSALVVLRTVVSRLLRSLTSLWDSA